MKSIGSITETIENLVARIDLNAQYVPNFACWQAQLLIIDDIKGDENYEDVLSAIQQLQHLELVAAFLEDLDTLMDEAFTREVNKLFIRGLILIAIILAGFATHHLPRDKSAQERMRGLIIKPLAPSRPHLRSLKDPAQRAYRI